MVPRREEIVGLIEQAMAQPGTEEYGDEDIDEQRLHLLTGYFLLLKQPLHEQVAQQKPYQPAGGIPSHTEAADAEHDLVGVPKNVKQFKIHNSKFKIKLTILIKFIIQNSKFKIQK
jgi:hypothetical protein